MKGTAAAATTLVALLLTTVPATAQTLPPSLTGEELVTNGLPGSSGSVSATCGPNGSTLTFEMSGTAFGPYPGTFTETGTVTSGPTVGSDSLGLYQPIVSLSANFSIASPTGSVQGTKTFVGSPQRLEDALVVCGDAFQSAQVNEGGLGGPGNLLRYDATIHTVAGGFRDRGTSNNLQVVQTHGSFIEGQEAVFVSEGVTPLLPTNPDQCKNGGWQTYGVFKNQGDCVSFVRTGAKNPPSGP